MKLLICDDDISTVDVIEGQLINSELPITGYLRAYNGQVAKEIIASERPELILCDIGMPKCDGLQVLKFVYEQGIETEFAFLTCYEDFEYAQTALRYGARNYITKPFEMEELKIALQQMIASHRRRQNGNQTQYDSLLSSVLRQLADGIYSQDPAAVDSLLQRNGLSYRARDSWQMVVTYADITDALRTAWSQELLMYTMGRLHDETLADYIGSGYTLTQMDDRYLQCICFLPEERCPADDLPRRCRQLLDLSRELIYLDPLILVSDPFPLHQAHCIREQMERKMRRMLRTHSGGVCLFSEAQPENPREDVAFLDEPQIHRYLKKHDAQGFRDYIQAVTQKLSQSHSYTRQSMDDLRRELIHVFSTCLRDNNISASVLFVDPKMSALDAASVQSAEHMRQFALTLFQTADSQLTALLDTDDIIARVESYIQAHFRENINRETVAAVAYITPNYLSKQFRSRKGMNLREYINQIRIEEAKRLLLTTNLSVSEVAGLSGYENISYFSTVFRKYTGMSPVDWRSGEVLPGGAHEAP